ncbi:MAG: hypothetical protein V2I43_11810 [Parvularcula sp.]|nr:hypothetical protein [Parvularcula sp.]
MTISSRSAVLLEADRLIALGPDKLGVTQTDLDELGRIALLVLISGSGNLQEMSERELGLAFDELLSEEDLAVLDRISHGFAGSK